MTTKTTHTPTPWKVAFPSGHIYEPATGFHVATMHPDILGFDARICEANAAHIVRCVNEREELLGTIESLFTLFICDTLSVPAKKRTWHVEGNIQGALDNANSILARAESEG